MRELREKEWTEFIAKCKRLGVEVKQDEDEVTLVYRGVPHHYRATVVTLDHLKEELTRIVSGALREVASAMIERETQIKHGC